MILARRKGQSSIEFVMILGILFFMFMAIFAVIQGRMNSVARERSMVMLDQIGNVVRQEVMLAGSARGQYVREFYLPELMGGYNYSIMSNQAEIAIRLGDSDYVIFLNQNITGPMRKGKNIIRNLDGNITLN